MNRSTHRALAQAVACLLALIACAGAAQADVLSITGQPLGGVAVSLTDSGGDPLAGPQSAGIFGFRSSGASSLTAMAYSVFAFAHPTIGATYAEVRASPFDEWADAYLTLDQRRSMAALFDRYFVQATTAATASARTSAAFQIALWEIAEETSAARGAASGDFRVAGAPESAALADAYLAGIGSLGDPSRLTAFEAFAGIALLKYTPAGESGGVAPVPEPAGLLLILVAAVALQLGRASRVARHGLRLVLALGMATQAALAWAQVPGIGGEPRWVINGFPYGDTDGRVFHTLQELAEFMRDVFTKQDRVAYQVVSAPRPEGDCPVYPWICTNYTRDNGDGTAFIWVRALNAGATSYIGAGAPASVVYQCPDGSRGGPRYVCPARSPAALDPAKNHGPSCPAVGNPINPATGNKWHAETDYRGSGPFPLVLARAYNSAASAAGGGRLGTHWIAHYERAVRFVASGSVPSALVQRADGRLLRFSGTAGGWIGDADIDDRLDEERDASGARVGWRYVVAADDTTESYDALGRLVRIATRSGLAQTLQYEPGPYGPGFDPVGRLARVSDPFGRTLGFGYDERNRLVAVTDPAGGVYRYAYDAEGMLAGVSTPEGTVRRYHYNEPALVETDVPGALTGVTDERGLRLASYRYDGARRAIETTHAGGAGRAVLTYLNSSVTSVQDALGTGHAYTFQIVLGVPRIIDKDQPGYGCGPWKSERYDSNANAVHRTDWNGHRTERTFDLQRNLEIGRVAAAGTAVQRITATEWHPSFRLATRIAEPKRITTNLYDDTGATCGARGALCSRTIQATSDETGAAGFAAAVTGAPRTWQYTYDAAGQVTSIDGPRLDSADLTRFTYDAQGNLASVTNALGHVTQLPAYDAHGNPLEIVDPNGLRTTLAYDARQRLVLRQVGNERTRFEYDPAGLLTGVIAPDGKTIAYRYDDAQRLIGLSDSLGNRIDYALDALGNRVREEIKDPAGNIARLAQRVYDPLGRLAQLIGGAGQLSRFEYDDQGNLTRQVDPLGQATAMAYDPLNRLVALIDPLGGRTALRHDGADQLAAVSDPRNLVTAYSRDGLGNEASLQSPDTGITGRTFDEAGNVRTLLDARGARFTNRYDALNRLVFQSVSGPDGVATASFAYDAPGALGRLASITERVTNVSLVTRFQYDAHGRIVEKRQETASRVLTVGYGYDAITGQMTTLRLPSGRVLGYRYGADGRAAELTLEGAALITSAQYFPFGPLRRFVFANGTAYERAFDADGRITAYRLGAAIRSLTYDAAGRILGIADTAEPALAQTLAYDALDRLTAYEGLPARQAFSYDATGNRTSVRIGGTTYPYAVDPASNKLLATDGIGGAATVNHDAMGNVLQGGRFAASYDARGRLRRVVAGANEVLYVVNALGQRVRKLGRDPIVPSGTQHFVYDEEGKLLGEYNAAGQPIQEFVYLGDLPVAVIAGAGAASEILNVWPDHLGTPRLLSDQSDRPRWRWDSLPFGESPAWEDPSGVGEVRFNLRFPGQYFDRESGLHQNYYRDYDPVTGRYTTSDPIGLEGGINTYAYAAANPLTSFDPSGLSAQALPFCLSSPAALSMCGIVGAGILMSRPGLSTNEGSSSTSEKSTENCCTEYRDVYEANPKHTPGNRWVGGQWISPEPTNGAAVLPTSVPVTTRSRVGFDPATKELIEFKLTRQDDERCIRIWHGYVISNQPVPIRPRTLRAARDAGFSIGKK